MHRSGHSRRVALGVVAVAVALGAAHNANAGPGLARAAAACPPITLRLNTYAPDGSVRKVRTRVAIKRHHVTCAKARRLITTYVRRATPRRCATHGSRCLLPLGGGWWCRGFLQPETESTGGEIMGCTRSRSTNFAIVQTPPQLEEVQSGDRQVWCGLIAYPPMLVCTTADGEHFGVVDNKGNVTLCNDTDGCTTKFGPTAPVINPGDTVYVSGYRCTAATDGFTCIEPATGHGVILTGGGASAV